MNVLLRFNVTMIHLRYISGFCLQSAFGQTPLSLCLRYGIWLYVIYYTKRHNLIDVFCIGNWSIYRKQIKFPSRDRENNFSWVLPELQKTAEVILFGALSHAIIRRPISRNMCGRLLVRLNATGKLRNQIVTLSVAYKPNPNTISHLYHYVGLCHSTEPL